MKFKVGDKVRVKAVRNVNMSCFSRGIAMGTEYIITSIKPNPCNNEMHYGVKRMNGVSPGYIIYEDELELVDYAPFTKSDLEDSMVVELRNGDRYFLCAGMLMSNNMFSHIDRFRDDLIHKSHRNLDIMNVYKTAGCLFSNVFAKNNLTLLWERKEKPTPKYKVGDRVMVMCEITADNSSHAMEIPFTIMSVDTEHFEDIRYEFKECCGRFSETTIKGLVKVVNKE